MPSSREGEDLRRPEFLDTAELDTWLDRSTHNALFDGCALSDEVASSLRFHYISSGVALRMSTMTRRAI